MDSIPCLPEASSLTPRFGNPNGTADVDWLQAVGGAFEALQAFAEDSFNADHILCTVCPRFAPSLSLPSLVPLSACEASADLHSYKLFRLRQASMALCLKPQASCLAL